MPKFDLSSFLEADIPAPVSDYSLMRFARRAMATTFEIALPLGTPDALAAAEAALHLIDDLEDQLTIYRDHSELRRLNATAADGPVPVAANLFDLLAECARFTNDTQGAFDVAVGALIESWGFHRRTGRVPTPRERAAAMACSGFRHVILDALPDSQLISRASPVARTVRYRRPGLSINLGSVGKGYALDRAADLLRTKWNIASALLHAGGSSLVAIGTPPGEPRGWPIAIRHPAEDGRILGDVRLIDQALGTSAATYQFFVYNRKKYGHVLDPRNGQPADGVRLASVIAPTGLEADALSTAFFVAGVEVAREFCRTRPELATVILPAKSNVVTINRN